MFLITHNGNINLVVFLILYLLGAVILIPSIANEHLSLQKHYNAHLSLQKHYNEHLSLQKH